MWNGVERFGVVEIDDINPLSSSSPDVMVSKLERRFVRHDRFFMKPCCLLDSRLYLSRRFVTLSLMSDSSTLHGTEVRLTGL